MGLREFAQNSRGPSQGGFPGLIARIIMRNAEMFLGLYVLAIYGSDLRVAKNAGLKLDPRWIFAITVGSLSAAFAILFMVPGVPAWRIWFVDGLLFFLYVVLSGIFGKLFMHPTPEFVKFVNDDKAIAKGHRGAVVDLINMGFWFITMCYGLTIWLKHRKATGPSRSMV